MQEVGRVQENCMSKVVSERHRTVSLRLRVQIRDEARKIGRGRVMKGLVSCSKEFGV